MSQNEISVRRPIRKKLIAAWNRRLAWVTVFVLVVMNVSVYADYFGLVTWLRTTGVVSSIIFILLLLVHSAFSVYLFGFPRFKWRIRVVHIYIGYCLFITTFLSQLIIGFEPYHIISYTLNWILILAHVALSTRFMLKRNVKGQPGPLLDFRGEKI